MPRKRTEPTPATPADPSPADGSTKTDADYSPDYSDAADNMPESLFGKRQPIDRLAILYVPLEDVHPHPKNPRKHSEKQVADLAARIRRVGWTNPMLVSEVDGKWVLRAGEGRRLAAKALGLKEVPVIDLGDMTAEEAMEELIADNRFAEQSEWDWVQLDALFKDIEQVGRNLDWTGFDPDERKKVKREAKLQRENLTRGGQEGEDDLPDMTAYPVTIPGDIWLLGPHRVICGDSLNTDTLDILIADEQIHLVATDPPYAVYGSATGIASDIADDKMVRPFFDAVIKLAEQRLPWFGHMYAFCDWRTYSCIFETIRRSMHMEPKNMLVWDKNGAGLGSNYANTHELVVFAHKLPHQTAMGNRPVGIRSVNRPNVMHYNRPTGDERHHNAAKPVALMRSLIENSTGPGDVVLDPFCGSGSTLIAADQVDRICLTCEMEPKWVDVTLARFQKLRELEPVLEATGQTYEEVKRERQTHA